MGGRLVCCGAVGDGERFDLRRLLRATEHRRREATL